MLRPTGKVRENKIKRFQDCSQTLSNLKRVKKILVAKEDAQC
jgi:hypothetical protein